jgi:hypothetical protein
MSIIQVERNAWRRVHADDAGVLVDAAAYYHAVCWAISRAQSHVLMSGWQFDSGVPLLKMCRPAPTYAFEVPRRCDANTPALVLTYDRRLIDCAWRCTAAAVVENDDNQGAQEQRKDGNV